MPVLDILMKKNVTLEYHFEVWNELVGDKLVPLISYSSQLEEQFTRVQCLKFEDFKNTI